MLWQDAAALGGENSQEYNYLQKYNEILQKRTVLMRFCYGAIAIIALTGGVIPFDDFLL